MTLFWIFVAACGVVTTVYLIQQDRDELARLDSELERVRTRQFLAQLDSYIHDYEEYE